MTVPEGCVLLPADLEGSLRYWQGFQPDPDLYMDLSLCHPYRYDPAAAAERFRKHRMDPNRRDFLLWLDGEPIGNLALKHIDWQRRRCELCIHLRDDSVKNRGHGTAGERLLLRYAFRELGMTAVYADAIQKNTRSQHVLEKVGFDFLCREGIFLCYRFPREKFDVLGAAW